MNKLLSIVSIILLSLAHNAWATRIHSEEELPEAYPLQEVINENFYHYVGLLQEAAREALHYANTHPLKRLSQMLCAATFPFITKQGYTYVFPEHTAVAPSVVEAEELAADVADTIAEETPNIDEETRQALLAMNQELQNLLKSATQGVQDAIGQQETIQALTSGTMAQQRESASLPATVIEASASTPGTLSNKDYALLSIVLPISSILGWHACAYPGDYLDTWLLGNEAERTPVTESLSEQFNAFSNGLELLLETETAKQLLDLESEEG